MHGPRPYGHDAILAQLTARLQRDRLAHALLFTGPAGIGKILAARTFAAIVFCTADTNVPCGECSACRQVAAGTHPDLTVAALPAGKKEIGIDLVRRLKHALQLHAISGARTVAIVDDADRLSVAAQNALLKTLEEPPLRSLIILVAASPGALLPTVRSRCQRVLFRPLDEDAVATVLQDAGVDADEARVLAAGADGSPGRALRLRALLDRDELAVWEGILADLRPDQYVSVVNFSKALGRGEQALESRLEWLLSWYRAAATAGTPHVPHLDAARAARCGEVVLETLQTLRRRNPNRPLLIEALGLRLARS